VIGAASTVDLVSYQSKSPASAMPMYPHGHPDPATLVSQGLYDPLAQWSSKQSDYLRGGSAPSTIRRDLQGISNSVPQWAWLSLGGLFLVMGIVAYRRQRKTVLVQP
jgi:hypothetical protein